jgi:hypothetical protein
MLERKTINGLWFSRKLAKDSDPMLVLFVIILIYLGQIEFQLTRDLIPPPCRNKCRIELNGPITIVNEKAMLRGIFRRIDLQQLLIFTHRGIFRRFLISWRSIRSS